MCVFRVLVHVKFRLMVAFLALFWQQYPTCPVPPSCLFSHSSASLPDVSVSVQPIEISVASEAFETTVFLLVWNCIQCTHSHLQPASHTCDIYVYVKQVCNSLFSWLILTTVHKVDIVPKKLPSLLVSMFISH